MYNFEWQVAFGIFNKQDDLPSVLKKMENFWEMIEIVRFEIRMQKTFLTCAITIIGCSKEDHNFLIG